MNRRSKEILYLLLERGQSTLWELAEIYEVSERTIRNDIAYLNDYLSNSNFGIIHIRQKQIHLELKVDKQSLYANTHKFNVYDYKFNSEERSLICLLILIGEKDYFTINQLSEKLLASRSTIVNDVKIMRELALKHNLKVESRANKGFKVYAKEENIRNFIYHILSQENFSILESIIFDGNYQQEIEFSKLQSILEENRNEIGVSEKFLNKLLTYLMISAYRNLKNFKIELSSSVSDEIFFKLKKVLKKGEYPHVSDGDLAYICREIIQEVTIQPIKKSINSETLLIQVTTMKFIEAISTELDIDFKDDYIFYENFSAHLVRMMRKEEHNLIKSLDISNVVNSNLKIKRVILKNLPIIEENIGRKASELEIEYILIHVYAAMERKKRIGSNLKVAILTEQKETGIFFIESKIVQNFSFSLDIYSIDDTIRGEYDLILTTTSLPNQNYLQISPFISDEDYILIASHINRIVRDKNADDISLDRDVVLKLYQMIAEEIDIDFQNKSELKERIKKRLFAQVEHTKEDSRDKMLHEFLTPNRIQVDITVDSWEESIYKAGQSLISSGDITEEYLDVVIENIKERGPYVVISQGFAFPHAQLGEYNKATSMSLVRLRNPIYFNDEEQDNVEDITTLPVKYVCILSTTDRKKHLKAIFNLFNLLKDEKFKLALDQSQTPEEIHQLIESQEQLLEIGR